MVRHKTSGQAIVVLRDPDGRRRQVFLGPFDSAEARRRYQEAIAQHLAGIAVETATAKAPPPSTWPTVSRLCADFLLHAREHYRNAEGKVSREVGNFVHALDSFLAVLRDRRTDSLTCVDLAAVRRHLAETQFGHKRDDKGKIIEGTGKTRCRTYVNSCMRRVRYVLRWGTENNLVPGPTWATLSAFRNLTHGRGGLRESEPVEAVPRSVVDDTLPHLPPVLQVAVELLWWSGMRAGELCQLRTRDIDRTGKVWIYRPAQHKGTWRGRERVVRFGPKCQELLRPLLSLDQDAFLFRAADVVRERRAARRARRKTKVQPSQVARAARAAGKGSPFHDHLDVATLRRAVHRACDKAGVARWGLHRLRHAAGTRLVKEEGDQAARLLLGHADERMVRRYSKAADDVLGAEVAARHA